MMGITREEFIERTGREPKVIQIQMNLIIEGTGGEVKATKIARIHEYDLDAGRHNLETRVREILIDAVYTFGQERHKDNTALFWDGKRWSA